MRDINNIREPMDAYQVANYIRELRPGDSGYNRVEFATEAVTLMRDAGWRFVDYNDCGEEVWAPLYLSLSAILSSPIVFPGGEYKCEEIPFPTDLTDVTHYVGHPATRALLEALGAKYAPGRWAGPALGDRYLAIPLAQNVREGGWTLDTVIESVSDLKALLITRVH